MNIMDKLKYITNKDKFMINKNQSFIEYIHENNIIEQFSWLIPTVTHGSWHMPDGLSSATREGIKISINYEKEKYVF